MKFPHYFFNSKYKIIILKIIFFVFNRKKNKFSKKNIFQQGFSIIELAVCLVIIGLFTGAILKGIEIVKEARLQATISQVQDIQLAISNFHSRYSSLPGDYKFASTYIKTGLKDGNQDGMISGDGLNKDSEAANFWHHLSASGLYTMTGAQDDSDQFDFGHGIPSAKIGGGFTIEFDPAPLKELNPSIESTHWIVLGKKNGSKGNGALLTPLQAKKIDEAADSGNPLSGRIRATDGHGSHGQCLINNQYNTKINEAVCVLYFQF